MRARVLIRPKAGILDPQGQAVQRALPALGFAGVSDVHVGRLVELDVDDPTRLGEMCERLLANPLIEDYEVSVVDSRPPSAAHAAPATRAAPTSAAVARAATATGPAVPPTPTGADRP